MLEEANLEFRKTDETRNYLLDEIKQNDFMNEKYKKTCKYLNYVENLFIIVASAVTGCISISAFASLVVIPAGVASSSVGIKLCAITGKIKKYKSLRKKKSKKHDKVVQLGKDKLNPIEVLISKALIDSYISYDEIVSVNNVLREYIETKNFV